jgi:hypothetical protein
MLNNHGILCKRTAYIAGRQNRPVHILEPGKNKDRKAIEKEYIIIRGD